MTVSIRLMKTIDALRFPFSSKIMILELKEKICRRSTQFAMTTSYQVKLQMHKMLINHIQQITIIIFTAV